MINTLPRLFAAAVIAVALPSAALAQSAGEVDGDAAAQAVRNVVLVHGAFVDGSGWRGVHDRLTQRGYTVAVVQNPMTSLADDVATTRRALDRLDGPAILVGHSWGGVVITEAGEDPRVAGLVYVSALSPDAGETTAQQYEGFETPPEFVIDVGEDGFGTLNAENFDAAFAADVDAADAAFMRDSQKPIAMAAFGETLSHAAWRTRPSWAVIATDDKAFDQRMLRHMADRIGAEVTEVAASHAVFITQADVVADVIDRAARAASAAGVR